MFRSKRDRVLARLERAKPFQHPHKEKYGRVGISMICHQVHKASELADMYKFIEDGYVVTEKNELMFGGHQYVLHKPID